MLTTKGQQLADLIDTNSNLNAFFQVIRAGEGTSGENGYRTMFGGELFDSFDDHPRRAVRKKLGSTYITSTAAGAPQFLKGTWDECAAACGLPDFSPRSQEIGMAFLIQRRGALPDVLAGKLESAIQKCNREWASLPGSPYGQPVRTMAQVRAVWNQYANAEPVQVEEPLAPPVEITPVVSKENDVILAPFIQAALPSLISAIPALGKIFGSGSEVAERNIAAAETVVKIVQQATGAKNVQEAVELVQSDPVMKQAAQEAVQTQWFDLMEVGGGVVEARKADAAFLVPGAAPVYMSPAFIISIILLMMPFMLMADLFFVHPEAYTGDIRTQIITAVLVVISMVGGYWIGTSFSSFKKDEEKRQHPGQ